MPKEVYISSSSPFSVVTYHGESTIGIYNSEPDGDEYGWPQDFYRDTAASIEFEDGVAVEITLEDEL